MNQVSIDEAVRLLAQARATGKLLAALPDACRPHTIDDAHAIQEALAAKLGERIAGWKIAMTPEGRVARGALVQSRVVATGASLPAATMPLLGVEAEIAFRFDRALPPRAAEYAYDDVAAAVTRSLSVRRSPIGAAAISSKPTPSSCLGDNRSCARSAGTPRAIRCCRRSSSSTICVTRAPLPEPW